jgi:hypothetical protein
MGIKGPYSKVWWTELYFMFAGPFFFQVIHNLQIDESKAFTFVKKVKNKVPNIDDDVVHSTFILQNKEHRTSKTDVSFTLNYSKKIVKMMSVKPAVY